MKNVKKAIKTKNMFGVLKDTKENVIIIVF